MRLIELYDVLADDTPVMLVDETGASIQFCADVYCWVDDYMNCEVLQVSLTGDAVTVKIRY